MRYKLFFISMIGLILSGCASETLFIRFEQSSDTIKCNADAIKEGIVINNEDIPIIQCRIDTAALEKIKSTEGKDMKNIVLICHKGTYYLAAEGFKNVWTIKPRKDGSTADCGFIPLPNAVKRPEFENTDTGVLIISKSKDRYFIGPKGKIEEWR